MAGRLFPPYLGGMLLVRLLAVVALIVAGLGGGAAHACGDETSEAAPAMAMMAGMDHAAGPSEDCPPDPCDGEPCCDGACLCDGVAAPSGVLPTEASVSALPGPSAFAARAEPMDGLTRTDEGPPPRL